MGQVWWSNMHNWKILSQRTCDLNRARYHQTFQVFRWFGTVPLKIDIVMGKQWVAEKKTSTLHSRCFFLLFSITNLLGFRDIASAFKDDRGGRGKLGNEMEVILGLHYLINNSLQALSTFLSYKCCRRKMFYVQWSIHDNNCLSVCCPRSPQNLQLN